MSTRSTVAGLLGAALIAAGCSESVGPDRRASDTAVPQFALTGPAAPAAPVVAPGIRLDVDNGSFGYSGTLIRKGFNPTNPHIGDAIVATFYWFGSTNIIESVTDVQTDAFFTPVGNKYTLVEYVTEGGVSMATYVATNVKNFPDPNPGDIVLAVQATLSQPITDGGIKISAWSGVDAVTALPVGSHRSASGSGSGDAIASPGSVAIGAGALAYMVTMSNGVVPLDHLSGFPSIGGAGGDSYIKEDGRYVVSGSIGSVNPQWNWAFNSPSTWLASALTLNPAPHLSFTVQPSTTLPLVAMRPGVQVTVLDALGNRATTFNGPVTITIGTNGGLLMPGTLSGTKTVTAANGVAVFSDLSIDQAGNGYTFVVNAAGLSGAESAPFNIGAM